jgi:isoquinoline 1-oxidoreductase beta subunit
VRAVGAPADAKLYNNLLWGQAQGTGGSTAMANSFEQYRQAGAAARAMLVSAAAKQWSVAADSIQVKNGVIFHANGEGHVRRACRMPPQGAGTDDGEAC